MFTCLHKACAVWLSITTLDQHSTNIAIKTWWTPKLILGRLSVSTRSNSWFPDIVKLNMCMLFYDYFHHDKFPNLPVSLVSELHNYSTRRASSNRVAIPSFRTNLRRFCPSIIGSFFWNNIPQSIRDKPSKKMFRNKAVTLLNTNENSISL